MNAEIPAVPALEIGGSHVSAALVDPQRWRVIDGTQARLTVDSNSGAGRLIERFLSAAASLPTVPLRDARCWGVAVPDPFDYEIGVALFEGVGKFESLQAPTCVLSCSKTSPHVRTASSSE